MIEIDELDYKRLIERSTRINRAIAYLEAGKTFPSDEARETAEYMQNMLLDILKGIDKDDRDSNNNDN